MKRLPGGGRIRRDAPVAFTWEGRTMQGFAGDTLASALLANGVRVVGRSFKYHRPRGIFGAGAEEPNAIVDLSWNNRHDPNACATQVELLAGMDARGVNGWPSVRCDVGGVLDRLHRFLPSGFYYKTFMAPGWHSYEPAIRRMAGLGRLRETADTLNYETRYAHCDVLVIGGGPAGLAAARAVSIAGLSVMLVEEQAGFGGSLCSRGGTIDDRPAGEWVDATIAALHGATLLPRTAAFGYYDHNKIGLIERRTGAASGWAVERLWQVRARQVVLATGAIERPLVFPDNDRPGIMSAAAMLRYLREYAVRAGERVLIATNNDSAYATALALRGAGAEVLVADLRDEPGASAHVADFGIRVLPRTVVRGTGGRHGVRWVDLAPLDQLAVRERIAVDAIAVSGGWSPAVHLFSQSGGKLRWDEGLDAFTPVAPQPAQHLAGALLGDTTLAAALTSGFAAGVAAAAALDRRVGSAAPRAAAEPPPAPSRALLLLPLSHARQWIDFQNDVTVADVALAARENYASVEHLKRYTLLGMANDQGKTSNINGLAALAHFTGRTIPEVGTTTFRPPFTPVSFGALAGLRHGPQFAPRRLLPAHAEHLAAGARFREYGAGWMRPACYPRAGESEAQAIRREAVAARSEVGIFDGSSLGKIEVHGPDAAAFLNLMYYNEVANLKPGRIRYCLLLRETGMVYDDGVVARMAPNRYLLSPSSSHTAGVMAMLELWHQTEYPHLRVAFHDTTAAWATIAVSGPRSRSVLATLDTDMDLQDAAAPHMSVAQGRIFDLPGRIARISFTGERSYEVSVPANSGAALWRHLAARGATPYGIEALSLLRAEKGFILIGTDTDGMTMPDDLGMPGPLRSKKEDFVGKRSLLTPDATRPDRRQLVGLLPEDPSFVPAVGAHAVYRDGDAMRSIGWVTTAWASPMLGRSIALGMIERGRALVAGKATVELYHLGETSRAAVTTPCFFDPGGERLHA